MVLLLRIHFLYLIDQLYMQRCMSKCPDVLSLGVRTRTELVGLGQLSRHGPLPPTGHIFEGAAGRHKRGMQCRYTQRYIKKQRRKAPTPGGTSVA